MVSLIIIINTIIVYVTNQHATDVVYVTKIRTLYVAYLKSHQKSRTLWQGYNMLDKSRIILKLFTESTAPNSEIHAVCVCVCV
jgi:hypothetical protein